MKPASGLWTSQAATRVRKRRPQTSGRRATRSPLRCRRPRRPPRPPRRHDRTCKTRRIRTCKCTHAHASTRTQSLFLSLSHYLHICLSSSRPPHAYNPLPPGARAITWGNVRVWSPWAAACWLLAVALMAILRRLHPRWLTTRRSCNHGPATNHGSPRHSKVTTVRNHNSTHASLVCVYDAHLNTIIVMFFIVYISAYL